MKSLEVSKAQIPAVYCNAPNMILLDKSKGSIGNKLDCAGAQLKNDVYSGAKTAVVLGAAAGTTYAATKLPMAAKLFAEADGLIKSAFMKIVGGPEGIAHSKDIAKPVLNFVKSSPACVKIAAGLAVVTMAATGLVKRGQIDQKYTDRAAAQKRVSE